MQQSSSLQVNGLELTVRHKLTMLLGTTGLPKGVLSTQRQFLSNSLNVCYILFLHVHFS